MAEIHVAVSISWMGHTKKQTSKKKNMMTCWVAAQLKTADLVVQVTVCCDCVVHVVRGGLQQLEFGRLVQRQELGVGRHLHPGQEVVHVVASLHQPSECDSYKFATCLRYYLLARSLLALPQQDQSSQDIRWHLQQLSSNQKFHETVIQIIALNRVRLIKKDFDRCSAQAKPTSCRSVSLVLLLFAQRPNVLRYSPHRGPGRIQTTAAQSQQRNSGQTWLEKVVEMWQVLLWFSCFVRVNSRKTTCTVGPRNSRKLASLSCSHTNIKCQCCIMPRYESSTCLFKN